MSTVFCLFVFDCWLITFAGEKPLIFPLPQEILMLEGHFKLDEETLILVPENEKENDIFMAHSLAAELSDKYGLGLKVERVSKLPSNKSFILIGTVNNTLVREYYTEQSLHVTVEDPGSEGYFLNVSRKAAVVAGCDSRGAFYGFQSLRQLIKRDGGHKIPCVQVRDWPSMPFRGIRLYIPGSENIPFFKRFLKDFMALYKFNKVILEVNACMRFDRHPELNAGWIELVKNMKYTRRDRPTGPGKPDKPSKANKLCQR